MSSTTPRETSGALPKWDGIQDADRTSIIKPIMEHFRQVTQAALQEHMNLVTSQYMTGWARASREGGIGAATPMNQPDLSNISAGNPVSTPDQTPVQRRSSPSRAYGGIVPSPTGYSSVASLARRGTSLREDQPETEPEPEGTDTGGNIDPTVAKELWERSVTDTNAQVAKGWAMLNNQIQNAGTWLAEELWNKASVPISKRNQQAFELDKEKTDPEVTAALRKHKIVYSELTKDLSTYRA